MHYTLGIFAAVTALLASSARADAQQPRETSRKIAVAGVQRSYLLYRPSRNGTRGRLPLVLVFHGGGGTARGIARHTGFTRLAEREGFVAVYPQGLRRRWNDGRGIHRAYDDVRFIRVLLDTLTRELPIDPRRIYATGISNGAVFVHRLACDLPGTFATIAPVAGAFPARMATTCEGAAKPAAVIAFQGTTDRFMPYRGSSNPAARGATLSAEQSAALWARANGCASTPTDSLIPERHRTDGTTIRRMSYRGCQTGRPVLLYRINSGGHTWPGGPSAAASVGRVSREVDATAAIWQFFTTVK